jgi:response regulator RpfG family c-di-GMP phosphodiesterase
MTVHAEAGGALPSAREPDGAPWQVLVVDDEVSIRRLLQKWVQAQGADVVEAGTSEEALSLIESGGAPAVALCDIRLPGKDGLWLAARLHEAHAATAVVMTTGVNEFSAAVTSLHAGVVDYLVKPFARERFVEALNRAFFAHKSRLALAAMHHELNSRRSEITEALAEIEMNSAASLDAMLGLLRARDGGACEHVRRVAALAVNLALALQIGEPRLSDIERAALLHTLGRLALPDALLSCPEDELGPDDRARLREYPLHGYAILRSVPFLAAAAEIAVAAHERCDGSGFPRGLRGDSIPLGARIIAVADAFDALTARGGGRRLTPADALNVLSGARAPEFDPAIVAALAALQGGGRPAAGAGKL